VASSQRQSADHAPPTSLRARAAAKVNLGLYVGPVRSDGRYHEVVSVLQSIAIWDELEVEVVPEGLGLEVEGGGLPAEETNLVLVAARELARRSRDLPGARFRLRKGIPVSAGLGGGSADGAAAHSTEAAAKAARPPRNTRLRPSRSASVPPVSRVAASARE
jgi:hypothetical protein